MKLHLDIHPSTLTIRMQEEYWDQPTNDHIMQVISRIGELRTDPTIKTFILTERVERWQLPDKVDRLLTLVRAPIEVAILTGVFREQCIKTVKDHLDRKGINTVVDSDGTMGVEDFTLNPNLFFNGQSNQMETPRKLLRSLLSRVPHI